jgi:hypothetical protein
VKGNGREADKGNSKGHKKGVCAITIHYQFMYVYITIVNAANNLMCLGYK